MASSINAQEGSLRAAATPSVVPGSAVTGGMAQGQSSLALALLDSLQRNMSEDADEGHRLLEIIDSVDSIFDDETGHRKRRAEDDAQNDYNDL